MSESNISLEQQLTSARQSLEHAYKEFHKLLKSTKLRANLSGAEKNEEKSIVDRIVRACAGLNKVNYGEGFMSAVIVALREQISVRDRVNELEFQIRKQGQELRKLKKELGVDE